MKPIYCGYTPPSLISVYQVNCEDHLSAFSVYQAKRLSYPTVYQSCRIVHESCSIVHVFNRIVRKSYPIFYLVKNNVAGSVVFLTSCVLIQKCVS